MQMQIPYAWQIILQCLDFFNPFHAFGLFIYYIPYIPIYIPYIPIYYIPIEILRKPEVFRYFLEV